MNHSNADLELVLIIGVWRVVYLALYKSFDWFKLIR